MISLSQKFQKTINNKINFEGVGLHSGIKSTLTLHPASTNYGIKFVIKKTTIPANIKNVNSTIRGTNLFKNNISIMTIEHLLSALYALEVDNLKIEISECEVPILDGTSQQFFDEITKVGLKTQGAFAYFATHVFDSISVNNCSEVKEFSIPQSSNPLTIEILEVKWDHSCTLYQKQGISDVPQCPWDYVWKPDCFKVSLQLATDYTRDIPH